MRIAMLLHKSVEFDSRVRREAAALAAAGHEVVVLELAPVPAGGAEPRLGPMPAGGAAPRLGPMPAGDAEPRLGSMPAGDAGMDGFARRSVLPPDRVRRLLPFHLYRLAFLLSFVQGIRAVRPDAVHAHDAAMLVPGVLGARLSGARLIYDSHELATGVPYRERAWAWLVSAIERVIVPRCDAVITVSDGIAARLTSLYGLARTPTVVRNVSALTPGGGGGLRARLGIGPEIPLVLHQGAPAPARGCEVMLDAVAALPGVRLVFLGDPEPGYGERLAAEIARRDLGDRVTMLPSVPLPELLAWTTEADAGVTLLQDTCENHRLALPNKLFEYVAAGVPVVAADLAEARRLVDAHGIGWCATPDDPERVAEALRRALAARGDPALARRLSAAAAELSWDREQGRLLVVYARLAPARRARPRSRRSTSPRS
jgi:glycosyltransferase involved in cell wall biosynthesis